MALLGVVGRQLVPRLAPWCAASSTSMVQGAPWGSSKVQGALALRHLHLSPSSPSANPSDVKSGFGPWDDKVAVAGTGALFHWPSYNERVYTPDGTYRCHRGGELPQPTTSQSQPLDPSLSCCLQMSVLEPLAGLGSPAPPDCDTCAQACLHLPYEG